MLCSLPITVSEVVYWHIWLCLCFLHIAYEDFSSFIYFINFTFIRSVL